MAKKIWFFSQASLHEGHAMTSDNPERIRNVLIKIKLLPFPQYSGATE